MWVSAVCSTMSIWNNYSSPFSRRPTDIYPSFPPPPPLKMAEIRECTQHIYKIRRRRLKTQDKFICFHYIGSIVCWSSNLNFYNSCWSGTMQSSSLRQPSNDPNLKTVHVVWLGAVLKLKWGRISKQRRRHWGHLKLKTETRLVILSLPERNYSGL